MLPVPPSSSSIPRPSIVENANPSHGATRYALRSHASSAPATGVEMKSKVSKLPAASMQRERERFYWLVALRVSKERHKGSLGRKWSIKIMNAADQLYELPSSSFTKAFRAMNGEKLAQLLRDRVLQSA